MLRPSLVAGIALLCTLVRAQDSALPAFEAVSIKLNSSGEPGGRTEAHNGRFVAVNVTLATAVRFAFNVRDYQVAKAPSWINDDRFDISGTAGFDANTPQLRPMVRRLLEERFKLQTHLEEQIQRLYILTADPRSRKLVANTSDEPGNLGASAGAIKGRNVPVDRLAVQLSGQLGRPVRNETRLSGNYDFKLTWQPEGGTTDGDAGPSLFVAIQEQLGLKLQSGRGSVEIVVIDRIERAPSAN